MRFKKTVLASAVLAATWGSAWAHVSYNSDSSDGGGTNPSTWTAGNGGYSGNLPANWMMEFHHGDTSHTASTADALSEGAPSGYVLDMGARSYKDGSTNWGHSADFGLLDLHEGGTYQITVSADNNTNLVPAFGVWDGWDTSIAASRHQAWLNNGAINPMGAVFGSTLTPHCSSCWAHASSPGGTATLTLNLTAGQYTLILGGYDSPAPGLNAYTATVSLVPIPAAGWLFGGALVGLAGLARRKLTLG